MEAMDSREGLVKVGSVLPWQSLGQNWEPAPCGLDLGVLTQSAGKDRRAKPISRGVVTATQCRTAAPGASGSSLENKVRSSIPPTIVRGALFLRQLGWQLRKCNGEQDRSRLVSCGLQAETAFAKHRAAS